MRKSNGIATTDTWRHAAKADREARAEHLTLPSGATILAARPEPLEWVMSGRIPQGLLAVALEDPDSPLAGGGQRGSPADRRWSGRDRAGRHSHPRPGIHL